MLHRAQKGNGDSDLTASASGEGGWLVQPLPYYPFEISAVPSPTSCFIHN